MARRIVLCSATILFAAGGNTSGGDFADFVVSYDPAPGQFVNDSLYSDPNQALGAPVGGGTFGPDNTKLVSLGGFGGSITLGFSQTVLDDPCNPYGIDAIVFGNAHFSGGDPTIRWAEAAVIEISQDVNNNGQADDPWYVIPGSHLPNSPPETAPGDVLFGALYDDDAGTSTPPANLDWFPDGAASPMLLGAHKLPAEFDGVTLQHPGGPGATAEVFWGYAELTPTMLLGDFDGDNFFDGAPVTPEDFYTVPDNPFAVGISPGSGGGDGFDIAWAVDSLTGDPAGLEGFDFIRISTGVDEIVVPLGEKSAEIGGVADVRSDKSFFEFTSDNDITIEDLYEFTSLFGAASLTADLTGEGALDRSDVRLMSECTRKTECADMGLER